MPIIKGPEADLCTEYNLENGETLNKCVRDFKF